MRSPQRSRPRTVIEAASAVLIEVAAGAGLADHHRAASRSAVAQIFRTMPAVSIDADPRVRGSVDGPAGGR